MQDVGLLQAHQAPDQTLTKQVLRQVQGGLSWEGEFTILPSRCQVTGSGYLSGPNAGEGCLCLGPFQGARTFP